MISVRNPDIDVPGFPDKKPDYPNSLKEKFADERWLGIEDPRLLDYENCQLVLIGAHKSLNQTDIKVSGKPDLFKTLGLHKDEWRTDALFNGKFAKALYVEAAEPRRDPH